jgi:two-component system OmpR family response regulator
LLPAGRRRILVVEDEPDLVRGLRDALEFEGFDVVSSGQGREGVALARERAPDLELLDLMLPDMNGFAVCEEIRAVSPLVPIIMLTARSQEADKIRGLEVGADDYVTKPFSLAELLARLRALARRGPVARPTVLEVGGLRLDPATRQVWRDDVEIVLSAREFSLLETFMRRPGQVLSHLQLLDAAWDLGYEQRSNVVEVYIRYLREKIDRPFGVKSIETVRGFGYRLRRDGGA